MFKMDVLPLCYTQRCTQDMTINLTLDPRIRKDGTQAIIFQVVDGREYRKKAFTGITIEGKYWDKKKQRVRNKYRNSDTLNDTLDELGGKIRTATDKYDTKQFNREQVIAYISGKTNFDTVDDYVETVIKDSRSRPTYIDYRTAINSIKTHTKIDRPLLFHEVNYNLLDKYKSAWKEAGLSPTAYNSNLDKIRAVMNDAHRKNYIYEKFTLDRRLKLPVKRKPLQTATPDDILAGIEKISNIYDWQAVGFWVLMFMTRGMYPADVVTFANANIKLPVFHPEMLDTYGTPRLDRFYLLHERSKTATRGNAEMKIRLDEEHRILIDMLKESVVRTHYPTKPEIVPPWDNWLAIFNYHPTKHYELHNNVWDYYKKRVKHLTGLPYKAARKTFNTIALELAVSDTVRRILLGHADPTVLRHYDNTRTERFEKQVEDAHIAVLSDFRLNDLLFALKEKWNTIEKPDVDFDFEYPTGDSDIPW